MEEIIQEKPKKGRPKKIENTEEAKPVEDGLVKKLLAKVEALEKQNINDQEKLKMLEAVADKGRMFNYESSNQKKQPMKVKLSKFMGGIIVGWRTIKDELIYHPTTGKAIGEAQEYEILVLDKENNAKPVKVNGYVAFSAARYDERIDCEVVGKTEDFAGNIKFDVRLPDDKIINLDSRFVN